MFPPESLAGPTDRPGVPAVAGSAIRLGRSPESLDGSPVQPSRPQASGDGPHARCLTRNVAFDGPVSVLDQDDGASITRPDGSWPAALASGVIRENLPASSARKFLDRVTRDARENAAHKRQAGQARLKLEVSRHSRLEVASAPREITHVPRANPQRRKNRCRPRGAAVNRALRDSRGEFGVLRNRADSRPPAART